MGECCKNAGTVFRTSHDIIIFLICTLNYEYEGLCVGIALCAPVPHSFTYTHTMLFKN
jgi:hypothetical protein